MSRTIRNIFTNRQHTQFINKNLLAPHLREALRQGKPRTPIPAYIRPFEEHTYRYVAASHVLSTSDDYDKLVSLRNQYGHKYEDIDFRSHWDGERYCYAIVGRIYESETVWRRGKWVENPEFDETIDVDQYYDWLKIHDHVYRNGSATRRLTNVNRDLKRIASHKRRRAEERELRKLVYDMD